MRVLNRFSRVRLSATPRAVAHQAALPMGSSRQEHWIGLPCPPPGAPGGLKNVDTEKQMEDRKKRRESRCGDTEGRDCREALQGAFIQYLEMSLPLQMR